jgi:hypothetical protein
MAYRGVKGGSMKGEKTVKTRRSAWARWTFLTLFLIGSPSFVHADIGDILLKFNPYIAVREAYSNNILLTKTNKLSDFITTVYPGLGFSDTEPGKYGVILDVVGGYTYYAKNHEFSYFSPSGNLDAWYAMTSNLTFRVRDYFVRSDAAREQIYRADASPNEFVLSTERGVHAIYLRNVVEPSVEYRFGRENLFSALYRNNIYRNQSPLFGDSQENTVSPKLDYWFNIRNGVTLEYILTFGHFENTPNLVGNRARGRYTYRFNPRFSLFGEYSFLREDFKNPGIDYDIHNPSLGMEYKFSPTLTGMLQGGYYWQIRDQGSTAQGPFYRVSLIQRAERTTYTLLLQGGYTQDYFTAQNLGFSKYYSAYGTISHRLTERITVSATGSVERPTLSNGRKDWIWIAQGGVSYSLLRWLSISLGGSYTQDHSNISTLGYKEYRVVAGITLGRPTSQQTILGQPTFLQTILR